ncbi:TetR family transcriptional regulator [Rhodococcus oxybenzonivorans]|uniref:TetR family transcriptional regulator n=1 Tax=Rhodococcus oxybenzonivorans TaxID=1990687 RepID=A0A2S2BSP2_9NOCA|nr:MULTISPECIES: TetR/AcrR family transcriptional regulator [Rhodococcus]AWK71603.1 TetR family transcriptional regulator [Rhodococcus oxybenzonivorans]QTJ65457.1 TetR/AcrR family transcriptional regulator [Rhodococcus sp. ZPP]
MRSRRKILDATLELIRSDGFDGVTIAAVAQAAGVTRQTVYSIFGSREELVSQAIAGLAVEVVGGIRSRLDATGTPFELVVELVVASRAAVHADPVLAALLQAEQGNPLFDAEMMRRAKPVARELLSPLVDRYPDTQTHLDDIVEILVRLGLSVIMFDDEAVHADDDLRRFLTRWLLPAMPFGS